ncbi:22111_t:CDS:10 [Entrophospora sp. SA101]|nr:22111_t:CDS:10 [Entrophospora sp. SA101]
MDLEQTIGLLGSLLASRQVNTKKFNGDAQVVDTVSGNTERINGIINIIQRIVDRNGQQRSPNNEKNDQQLKKLREIGSRILFEEENRKRYNDETGARITKLDQELKRITRVLSNERLAFAAFNDTTSEKQNSKKLIQISEKIEKKIVQYLEDEKLAIQLQSNEEVNMHHNTERLFVNQEFIAPPYHRNSSYDDENDKKTLQLLADEELARQLHDSENGGKINIDQEILAAQQYEINNFTQPLPSESGGGGANSSRSSRNNADAAMGVILSCSHGFCFLCISKYVNVEIQGDNIKFPILCPVKSATCQKDGISEGIIEQALSREDLEKYYRKMAEMAIGDKKVSPWHNEYQALPADQRSPEDLDVINLVKKEGWKRCPRCNFLIQKNGGCNHMTCKCKAQLDRHRYESGQL